MKRYYVAYYRDFGNTYNLFWASDEHPEPADFPAWNAERITRKKAEALARSERKSQKHDPAFSGFADSWVWPIDWPKEKELDDRILHNDGVILDYIKY